VSTNPLYSFFALKVKGQGQTSFIGAPWHTPTKLRLISSFSVIVQTHRQKHKQMLIKTVPCFGDSLTWRVTMVIIIVSVIVIVTRSLATTEIVCVSPPQVIYCQKLWLPGFHFYCWQYGSSFSEFDVVGSKAAVLPEVMRNDWQP